MFICRYCEQEKELSSENFKIERRTKFGFDTVCRLCRCQERNSHRASNREQFLKKEKDYRKTKQYKDYHTQYWNTNRDTLNSKASERYFNNPTAYLKRSKEQRLKDPVAYKKYLKKWRTDNQQYLNQKQLLRLRNDPQFKMRQRLSGSLRKALKLQGGHKNRSILKYIGCTLEYLKLHMESLFKNGMTWENHGRLWHIDHILPSISFNLLDESEIFKCYHYSNLQPLLIGENLTKGATLPDGTSARKTLTTMRSMVSS